MMRAVLAGLVMVVGLSGCGDRFGLLGGRAEVAAQPPAAQDPRPRLRPDAPGKQTAPVVGQGPVERPEQDKGVTTATLGVLDRAGLWVATPMVTQEAEGRVVYLETGASANLTLIPNGAEAGGGAQLSLAAMQVLGIPLTELARVQIFIR